MGKSHKLPFPKSCTKYISPLQFVVDVRGATPVLSLNGFQFYVLFVYAYSNTYGYIFLDANLMHTSLFFIFKAQVELQLNQKIKILLTDMGGDFIALTSFFNSCGICICILTLILLSKMVYLNVNIIT